MEATAAAALGGLEEACVPASDPAGCVPGGSSLRSEPGAPGGRFLRMPGAQTARSPASVRVFCGGSTSA